VKDQVRAVLFSSWINLLLLAVPVGFVVNYLHVNGIAIVGITRGGTAIAI